MGGVSTDSGGKGGRKSVDQQVNMVPFIDLLISLIAFLLMTAVWVQSGTLEAQQPAGAPSADSTPQEPVEQLKIFVRPNEIAVGMSQADTHNIANGPQQWDQLRAKLREKRNANRQQREVWVSPDSAVNYNTIVRVMDVVYEIWAEGQSNPDFRELVTIRFL
jgi:biopolymer transport protein ExbD